MEDLHQIKPVEHVEPSQHTEIRLFYTEDALYIGARMLDTQADKINAQVLKQGGSIFSDDYFGFSIDPYLDKRNGYAFILNPNGVRWDALFKNITEFVGNWDGIWQGEAKIDEEGWTAEIRMPFQTLSPATLFLPLGWSSPVSAAKASTPPNFARLSFTLGRSAVFSCFHSCFGDS